MLFFTNALFKQSYKTRWTTFKMSTLTIWKLKILATDKIVAFAGTRDTHKKKSNGNNPKTEVAISQCWML